MEIYSIKEARANLSELISRAQKGQEIILTRRGKEAARLMPPRKSATRLPSLRKFRDSIEVRGEPLSQVVIRQRESERY